MPGLHTIALFVIFSLALGSLAELTERQGRSSSAFARRRSRNLSRGGNVARASGKTYTLQDMYKGESFLDNWEFMVGNDPTHGNVQYQSRDDAVKKHLAYVQEDGTTVLAVDDTTPLPRGAARDSVRISTKKKYNGGLFIADFFAMPHGCSIWPAYWSVGPDWPNGGEIDIVEGINDQPTNQYTLHSGPNCNLTTGNTQVTGRIGNRQCATINGVNTGCYFADDDTRSYGKGFNLIAGGVFAHQWDQDGLKIWHFPRTEIPPDITQGNPDPSTWPAPVAYWAATQCNMAEHFYEHSLVIDTTLCGDWAGGSSYKSAGCPGTDCTEAVMDPTNYIFAKWKINYIAVYQ